MVPLKPEEQYAGLSQPVAVLLSPTITAAVDRAIAAGITQHRKEMGDHANRLSELEHHVSDLEDELQSSYTSGPQSKQAQQFILDKLDDLQICSPEGYSSSRVHKLRISPASLRHTHPDCSGHNNAMHNGDGPPARGPRPMTDSCQDLL